MTIIWLAHEGIISGANLCLLEYLAILKKHRIECHLVVPYSKEQALIKKAGQMNVPATQIKFYSWTLPLNHRSSSTLSLVQQWLRNRIAIKKLNKLINSINPDFIATNTISSSIAAWAAKRMNKKHIWFIHEFGEEDHGIVPLGSFTKAVDIMNRLSYKLVFNSQAVQKKYETLVPASKQVIVTYSVNTPTASVKTSFPQKSILNLIMLGQIAPGKNHIEAFKALGKCKQRGLAFRLNIVGKAENPEFMSQLVTSIGELGLEENVSFIGPLSEPAIYLQTQHVLLMCSKMEAFGRVTVEALKLGVPVIAANKGGSLEIIDEGINGLFYESGDHIDLASKIIKLAGNYNQYNKIEIARKARIKYNDENTFFQLQKVFA